MTTSCDEVLARLRGLSNAENAAGMARYGIRSDTALGIRIPDLRAIAREIGTDHALAQELWASGIHEARILASMIDDPDLVTEEQIEQWVADFDSWDVCDQCCSNLFDKTEFAHQKAVDWMERDEEFVKRAGFVLMATLAVHDKNASNSTFEQFLPLITREATDERNYVKKAVNWALRQIGKRNRALNERAVAVAKEIAEIDATPARWIASDALRELQSEKVQQRLRG